MKYNAIIVEDEPIAAKKLIRLLGQFSQEIEIIAKAVNGFEAVKKINSLKPDLIFLDIQMPGLNGFEVLEKLNYLPLIIFTTAYDEHALQAFEENTIDYLLKPISSQKLAKALQKLKRFQVKENYDNSGFDYVDAENNSWQNMVQKLMQQVNKPKYKIAINLADRIIFLDQENIYFLQADKKYTEVHLYNKKYLISKTLKELELLLENNFIRLHRSNLVNKNCIKEVIKLSSRKWVAKLSDSQKTELPISRDYREKLFE